METALLYTFITKLQLYMVAPFAWDNINNFLKTIGSAESLMSRISSRGRSFQRKWQLSQAF